MALNQEENVCGIKFDDECFVKDAEREHLVFFDDFECAEKCEDIADLLPYDPFGMEHNIGLPINLLGPDFSISLPKDPFGMDFNTVAAITGLIEEFGLKACGFNNEEVFEDKNNDDDNKFFAQLNVVWTSSMKCDQDDGENEDGSYDDHDMLGGDVKDSICFGRENYQSGNNVKVYNDAEGGAPADALFYALGYLGVRDLLSVERVCKSLRDAVRNDPLLWRNIHIDIPFSCRIKNDDLVRLTDRAQDTLSSLSLVTCLEITNASLKRVLKSNPKLTKLSVSGCVRLKIEDFLHDLKVFNSVAVPGIKHLRIGNLFGLTNQQFEELKLLLGEDEKKRSNNYKPRFYHVEQSCLPLDDERAIDVETCPRCQRARQVYDCPSESLSSKGPFH